MDNKQIENDTAVENDAAIEEKAVENTEDKAADKWEFEDYAFTIATVLFLAPFVIPIILPIVMEILYSIFGFAFAEGWVAPEFNFTEGERIPWFAFSWMWFMFAWLASEIYETYKARTKSIKEYAYQFETSIYIAVTIALLIRSIIWQEWSGSWLASPITWAVFAVIRLLSKRFCEDKSKELLRTIIRMSVLAAGLIVDLAGSSWFAFPLAWVFVSVLELYEIIRARNLREDLFDVLYSVFSIIFISIALIWGFWITSWLALPIAWVIMKVIVKLSPPAAAVDDTVSG